MAQNPLNSSNLEQLGLKGLKLPINCCSYPVKHVKPTTCLFPVDKRPLIIIRRATTANTWLQFDWCRRFDGPFFVVACSVWLLVWSPKAPVNVPDTIQVWLSTMQHWTHGRFVGGRLFSWLNSSYLSTFPRTLFIRQFCHTLPIPYLLH